MTPLDLLTAIGGTKPAKPLFINDASHEVRLALSLAPTAHGVADVTDLPAEPSFGELVVGFERGIA
ncbi:MAG: hypothetical protein ACLPSW_20910 [Roseiarcus sp.]|jgi:hypothetical protein